MPTRATTLILAVLLGAVLLPAAPSLSQGAPVCRPGGDMITGGSPGGDENPVTHVCNIPETNMISAEFATTGNFLYASSLDSLNVYSYEMADGVPSGWTLEGSVPIVNFENESMTYGERRNGAGEITDRFVIMADDLVTAHEDGAHTGGENVVIIDVTDPTAPYVRSEGEIPTSTHTVQCVDRLACDYAYSVGGEGVFTIIDLRDLDAPAPVAGREAVPSPAAGPNAVFTSGSGHDWWFDEAGIGWHTGSGGIAAFDVTDPLDPVLLNQGDETAITPPLNNFILHNAKRPNASAFDDTRETNEPNLAKGNVALVTEEDYFNTGQEVDCSQAGLFQTWYVPNLDGSDVAADAADAVPGTGSIRNLDSINAPLEQGIPAGGFCSAHWFDYHETGIVAEAFYQGGFHLIDVRDPSDLKPYGFAHAGLSEVWDAYWIPTRDADGVLTGSHTNFAITADLVRGLDVFEVDLPDEVIEPLPATGVAGDTVSRFPGDDRIDTSVKASVATYDAADHVILARSDTFPDALTASTLATELGAPVLLTPTSGLDPRVADEIERLGAGTVLLMGGEVALSAQVESDLDELDVDHTRIGGADRFHTAALIADEVVERGGAVDRAIVALGQRADDRDAWPDALAASNLATTVRAPILLSWPDELPAVTSGALADLLDDGDTVNLAGGPIALDTGVEASVAAAGFDAVRLAGADRYGTAVALADEAVANGADREPTLLVSGQVFADALVAGPAATHLGGILLLVDPDDLSHSAATRDHLIEHADEIATAILVGGPLAISEAVRDQVLDAIDGD